MTTSAAVMKPEKIVATLENCLAICLPMTPGYHASKTKNIKRGIAAQVNIAILTKKSVTAETLTAESWTSYSSSIWFPAA